MAQAELKHYIALLTQQTLVNIKLERSAASVAIYRDAKTADKAAQFFAHKKFGGVEVDEFLDGTKVHEFTYPKKGGGEVKLYGVQYDNTKSDPAREPSEEHPPTPAEVLDANVPVISVNAKNMQDPEVKAGLEQFLRERSKQKN